jgi:hypothetical protein
VEVNMIMQLLKVIDTMRVVRQDAQIWTRHLTGEGATTVRRQREAVARAFAAGPLAALRIPSERLAMDGAASPQGRL